MAKLDPFDRVCLLKHCLKVFYVNMRHIVTHIHLLLFLLLHTLFPHIHMLTDCELRIWSNNMHKILGITLLFKRERALILNERLPSVNKT